MLVEKINAQSIQWGHGNKKNQFKEIFENIEMLKPGEAVKVSFDVPRTSFIGECYKTFNANGHGRVSIKTLVKDKVFGVKKV